MNIYVKTINDAVNYIEDNIHEKVTLDELASRFCISKFHFDRMFKTVAGMTLKQYILGRKLTEALKYLDMQGVSVIDAAYEFGFEYPEVFSRAFKKQFGAAPSIYSSEGLNLKLVNKASIVERDIVSYKGSLTLKGSCEYLNELYLQGISIEVDTNSEDFEPSLKAQGDKFYEEFRKLSDISGKLYTVVNCHELANGEYTVFYGVNEKYTTGHIGYDMRIVPSGWYVRFIYIGDMFRIRESFVDDLYRWIMVKEVELNPNGIGMLNIFDQNYLETNTVEIYVPVKEPK